MHRARFYEPNAHRANLIVLTSAHATRVLFDPRPPAAMGADLVARGIEFVVAGVTHVIRAEREVVLSTNACPNSDLFCVFSRLASGSCVVMGMLLDREAADATAVRALR